MKAAFRTPLTPREIRRILAGAPPERIDCALLRYAAPSRAFTSHTDDSGVSSE